MMFNLLASNVPFFYLGSLLVKASCFSLPGQVFCLFLSSARNGHFLRSQNPTLSPRPPGITQLVESLAEEAGKCGRKPISPLDPNSPLIHCGLVMAA